MDPLLQPNNIEPGDGEVPLELIPAASNFLHEALKVGAAALPGAMPRVATRRNPSLDNYLADLLLRTSYGPSNAIPAYSEEVVHYEQGELCSTKNPWLEGAVLIGIGSRSKNPGILRSYDEHMEGGKRSQASASQIVFDEHLAQLAETETLASLKTVLAEISAIDSGGGAGYDHLFSITKSLHLSRHGERRLEAQEKRAIVDAFLAAACCHANLLACQSPQAGRDELKRVWGTFLRRRKNVPRLESGVARWVERKILNPRGHGSPFALRKLYLAALRMWRPDVVDQLTGHLFEALVQAQQSFVEVSRRQLRIQRLGRRYDFLYYTKRADDKLPHRALLARMNKEKRRALVVVKDPEFRTVSVLSNNYVSYEVWQQVVEALIGAEGPEVWYSPVHFEKVARFVLNRTESYVGAPETALQERDFLGIFRRVVEREN